jgi:hypothetical protein
MALEGLIQRAVPVKEHPILASYDQKHILSSGYWICKLCRKHFYNLQKGHRQHCSLRGRVEEKNASLIYVLGPNENGASSPFDAANIETIKETARKNAEKNLPLFQRNKLSFESTTKCIEEYFMNTTSTCSPLQKQELRRSLEDFLLRDKCKAWKNACRTPIVLLYVCQAWEHNGHIMASRITDPDFLLSNFYGHTIEVQCARHAREYYHIDTDSIDNSILGSCQNELRFAEYCAFWNLQEETHQIKLPNPITYVNFPTKTIEEEQTQFGFIFLQNGTYRFIHPIFQHFFAAKYLIGCLKSTLKIRRGNPNSHNWVVPIEVEKYIQTMKDKPDLFEMWTLVNSLLNSSLDKEAWNYYCSCRDSTSEKH